MKKRKQLQREQKISLSTYFGLLDSYTHKVLAVILSGLLQVHFIVLGNFPEITNFTLFFWITGAWTMRRKQVTSRLSSEGYRVRQKAHGESQRVQRPKHCEYSNQVEYSSPQCAEDNSRNVSPPKYRQNKRNWILHDLLNENITISSYF